MTRTEKKLARARAAYDAALRSEQAARENYVVIDDRLARTLAFSADEAAERRRTRQAAENAVYDAARVCLGARCRLEAAAAAVPGAMIY